MDIDSGIQQKQKKKSQLNHLEMLAIQNPNFQDVWWMFFFYCVCDLDLYRLSTAQQIAPLGDNKVF